MPKLSKSASKKAKEQRMGDEMRKFKSGELRSGSGRKVTSRKQAIAIALSVSGQSREKSRKKTRKSSRSSGRR
jgi:hypothetical protein